MRRFFLTWDGLSLPFRRNHTLAFVTSLLLVGVVALGPRTAQAIPLISGLGGPDGYGPNQLMTCDDCFSDAIDITPAFPGGLNFFGTTYMSMYLNNNGNISFNMGLFTFTPEAFPEPVGESQPTIAPWWADVDTRGGGAPATNSVWWYIEPNRVIVTWHNVGYYSEHDDLTNDFQMILSTSATCASTGDFNVEFRYNQCQWVAGDASGGTGGTCAPGTVGSSCTPAQVGFDAGDGHNYVSLPMSLTLAILDVCTMTNITGGAPGDWAFQVRGGAVATGCAGGGAACTVPGLLGACAMGVTQCSGMTTTCIQVNRPQPQACNGLDNDCDGVIDTGNSLCPTGDVCDRGSCVPECMPELGCLSGQTCMAGSCIETDCLSVTCMAGQRCTGGMCVGICDGITCPHGQSCRAGRCVDPCVGLICPSQQICQDGMCVPACQCQPCTGGSICQPNGACADPSCVGVSCPTGTYCQGGMCLNSCAAPPDTTLCFGGEICTLGQCVPGVGADAGVDGGTADAGPGTDAMSTADAPSTGTDTGPGVDAAPDSGNRVILPSARGCSCRVGEGSADHDAPAGAALAFALLALRRRRARA